MAALKMIGVLQRMPSWRLGGQYVEHRYQRSENQRVAISSSPSLQIIQNKKDELSDTHSHNPFNIVQDMAALNHLQKLHQRETVQQHENDSFSNDC